MSLNIKSDRVSEINDSNESRDFTPVPDGSYCASIFSVEDCTREAKSGNTLDYIKCHFKLEGGQYNNRREFQDIVYSNSGSEVHGEIGQKTLARLYSVLGGTGDLTVDSLGDLKGCFELVIKTVPAKNPQYGDERKMFFNKCKDCPSHCDAEGCAPSTAKEDSGDIW